MRPRLIVQAALAMVLMASVTVNSAHAHSADDQKSAKAYVLSEIMPHDREAYIEYLQNVMPIIERHGGKVVINPFQAKTLIEGRALEGNLALIEFPSSAARDAFWNSPDYQPWKEARQANATSRIIHID